MAYTDLEVEAQLRALFPPRFFDWLLAERGDGAIGDLLLAIAEEVNADGFTLTDTLAQEINPTTAVARLPDWEEILAVALGRIATYGTTATRQAQILSRLRESGASTLPNIRAALGPLLTYVDSSLVDVVECSRAALTQLHTYSTPGPSPIPATGTIIRNFSIPDDAFVSGSGVQATFAIDPGAATLANLSAFVTAPDGTASDSRTSSTWGLGIAGAISGQTIYTIALVELAGNAMRGTVTANGDWILSIVNSGAGAGTLAACSLFVEGINRDSVNNDGLGAAIFEWGVFVNPLLVTVSGGVAGLDVEAIRKAIRRWAPGHTISNVIRGSPTVSPGNHYAVPDDIGCIPDQVIPSDNDWPGVQIMATADNLSSCIPSIFARCQKRKGYHIGESVSAANL